MTGENIKEMVARSFPQVGGNEILILINQALAQICSGTACLAKSITGSSSGTMDQKALVTVANQRLYSLPEDCLYVYRVDYGGYKINEMNIEESVLLGDTT